MATIRTGANDDGLSNDVTLSAGTEPPESILSDAFIDSAHVTPEEVDLETLKAEIAHLKQTVARLLEQKRARAADYVRDVTGDLMWSGLDVAAYATARTRLAVAEMESATRRNPLGALATAFVIGLLFGLRRRRR